MYIFWFLHQTTTNYLNLYKSLSCISFDSYIKPQPACCNSLRKRVVYLLIPTSNHNRKLWLQQQTKVVYLLIPTSNHNQVLNMTKNANVVYLLIPTSNHNNGVPSSNVHDVVYLLIPTSNHNDEKRTKSNS